MYFTGLDFKIFEFRSSNSNPNSKFDLIQGRLPKPTEDILSMLTHQEFIWKWEGQGKMIAICTTFQIEEKIKTINLNHFHIRTSHNSIPGNLVLRTISPNIKGFQANAVTWLERWCVGARNTCIKVGNSISSLRFDLLRFEIERRPGDLRELRSDRRGESSVLVTACWWKSLLRCILLSASS